MPADSISGGCACGSIRFTIHQAPSTLRVCVCHCRQCQRAAGGYFATLTKVAPAAGKFVVTKGKISFFASSAVARRGFCKDCGSPLTFQYNDAPHLSVCVGSLDGGGMDLPQPYAQFGCESQCIAFARMPDLPTHDSNAALGARKAALPDGDGSDGRRVPGPTRPPPPPPSSTPTLRAEHALLIAAPLALATCIAWADANRDDPAASGATLFWWAAQAILCTWSLALALARSFASAAAAAKSSSSSSSSSNEEDGSAALEPEPLARTACCLVALMYVLRAVFNSQETERLCILPSRLASALAHRTFAALGETVAYCLLLRGLVVRRPPSQHPRTRDAPLLALLGVGSIVVAQALSFYGVVIKSEAAFVVENALWTANGLVGLLLHVSRPADARFPKAGALLLAVYVAHMAMYDLPMYYRRAHDTRADPEFNVPFATGLADSLTCGVVSTRDADWRGAYTTHLLNFALFPPLLLLVTYPSLPPRPRHEAARAGEGAHADYDGRLRRLWAAVLFCYGVQLAGYAHIASHWLVAHSLGVPARLVSSWQKALPFYGMVWDKLRAHGAFMCAYTDERALRDAAVWQRVAISFAGPYGQALYLLFLGWLLPSSAPRWLGGASNGVSGQLRYALCVCVYTLAFLVWSAIWFYDDPTGDFALLTASGFEGAAAAYRAMEVARGGGAGGSSSWLSSWARGFGGD